MSTHVTSDHLRAFSRLLADDPDTGRLNHRHLQLLAFCCEARGPQTQGAMAAALAVSPSTISRALDKLLENGLLDRVPDGTNQRIGLIIPTKAGHALNQRVRRHYETARPATAQRAQPAA